MEEVHCCVALLWKRSVTLFHNPRHQQPDAGRAVVQTFRYKVNNLE